MRKYGIIPFVFFVFIWMFCPVYADAGLDVIINEDVVVNEGEVLLKDISQIKAGSDDLKKISQKMQQVRICRCPGPGQYVRISRAQLVRKINRAGFSDAPYVLKAPRYVKVRSSKTLVSKRDVVEAAVAYLKAEGLYKRGVRFKGDTLDGRTVIPAGDVTYKCSAGEKNVSMIKVNVDVMVGGEKHAGSAVSFRLPYQRAVSKKASSASSSKAETKKDEKPPGKRIKRGDPIKIRIMRKNMTFEINGRAAEYGRVGQTIRIYTGNGKKIIRAEVVNCSTALLRI